MSIKTDAIELLRSLIGTSVSFESFLPVAGGCINHGGQLKTSAGSFFIKWNDAQKYPGMFQTEAKGLNILRGANAIHIPKVVGIATNDTQQFIILEFIKSSAKSSKYWETFGHQLALLHKKTNTCFGLDHQNYIGSLPQYNDVSSSWIKFFTERRLHVQLGLAQQNGLVPLSTLNKFEALIKMFPSILPEEQPSLLHGDLWSGNLITDNDGNPCLIDPAVYYGHREAELAFTKLFGGFDDDFYSAYREAFPLQAKFEEREDIYNLYPLLVHANLFGNTYMNRVNIILDSFL